MPLIVTTLVNFSWYIANVLLPCPAAKLGAREAAMSKISIHCAPWEWYIYRSMNGLIYGKCRQTFHTWSILGNTKILSESKQSCARIKHDEVDGNLRIFNYKSGRFPKSSFTPISGRFPFWLINIFQRGWNHQLEMVVNSFSGTFQHRSHILTFRFHPSKLSRQLLVGEVCGGCWI